MGQSIRVCFLLGILLGLLVAWPMTVKGMATAQDGSTVLSKDEVGAIVDTITKQQEQIKALQRRLTTCFNNT